MTHTLRTTLSLPLCSKVISLLRLECKVINPSSRVGTFLEGSGYLTVGALKRESSRKSRRNTWTLVKGKITYLFLALWLCSISLQVRNKFHCQRGNEDQALASHREIVWGAAHPVLSTDVLVTLPGKRSLDLWLLKVAPPPVSCILAVLYFVTSKLTVQSSLESAA